MWASIKIGLTIIEMSTTAVEDMPYTLTVPFPSTVVTFLFLMFWVWGLVTLYSASELETVTDTSGTFDILCEGCTFGSSYKMIRFDFGTQQMMLWVHLFFGLWNLQFLNYLTFTILAGTFADWYFADWNPSQSSKLREEEADEDHRLSNSPIWDSMYRVFRFHMGTVLLALLIVAIVDFVRCVVYYIKKQTEKNEMLTYIGHCIDCVLWCVRCCLDIISKNTLIYTAIWGTPFCASATCSFGLMLANASVAFAVGGFSWIIMLMGKVLVACSVTFFCHAIIRSDYAKHAYEGELSQEFFILAVVFIVSYMMAVMFMSVYEVAIDSIMMGYMVAPERADESLNTLVDETKLDENDPQIANLKKHHQGIEMDDQAEIAEDPEAQAVNI